MKKRAVVHTLLGKKLVYSGYGSYRFWRRINALPDAARWRIYSMACVLQNIENAVIADLEASEKRMARRNSTTAKTVATT